VNCTVYGADPVHRNHNSHRLDLKVGTLVDPDKGKNPVIMRGLVNTMSRKFRDSLKESINK